MSAHVPHDIVTAIAHDFVLIDGGPQLPATRVEAWAEALLVFDGDRDALCAEVLAFARKVAREAGAHASAAVGQLVSLAGVLLLDAGARDPHDVDTRALLSAARIIGSSRPTTPVGAPSGPNRWLAARVASRRGPTS